MPGNGDFRLPGDEPVDTRPQARPSPNPGMAARVTPGPAKYEDLLRIAALRDDIGGRIKVCRDIPLLQSILERLQQHG